MPIYEAKCPICGKEEDYFRKVADYQDTPECCGQKMEKQLSCPNLSPDIANWDTYVSPTTGRMISSKAQRRRDMAESGCRDWEGREQETKVAQQREKDFDKMLDKSAEKSAVEAWHTLPQETKKQLGA
jgi:putative FmdB family regulatory protein